MYLGAVLGMLAGLSLRWMVRQEITGAGNVSHDHASGRGWTSAADCQNTRLHGVCGTRRRITHSRAG